MQTIQGTQHSTFVTDAGAQTLAANDTRLSIAALVPNGSGGYTTIAGTGASDGSFTITNVPAGNYLLQIGCCTFISTTSSTPDIGFNVLGRVNRQKPTLPTQITLAVSNANPLQSSDALQLYVSNTAGYGMWYGLALSGVTAGSTSFSPTLPWSSYLIDASQGDTAYLMQLIAQQASGYTLNVVQKAAGPLAFTQTDGSTTVVPAAMDWPHTAITTHLAFQGSAFAALANGINPRATPYGSYIYFDVSPASLSFGQVGSTPDLIAYLNANGSISTDVDFGTIGYGNPFSASWQPFLVANQVTEMTYIVPGATPTGLSIRGAIHVTLPASQSAAIAPLVGPVASPTINGQSFFNDQAGVGTMPILRWSAPQVGVATGYMVYVAQFYVDSQQQPASRSVAWFYTAGTSQTFPPSLLVSGNSYFAVIQAVSNPAYDITQSPFRVSIPFGSADALSGLITP